MKFSNIKNRSVLAIGRVLRDSSIKGSSSLDTLIPQLNFSYSDLYLQESPQISKAKLLHWSRYRGKLEDGNPVFSVPSRGSKNSSKTNPASSNRNSQHTSTAAQSSVIVKEQSPSPYQITFDDITLVSQRPKEYSRNEEQSGQTSSSFLSSNYWIFATFISALLFAGLIAAVASALL